jgi:tetrahedral aminopeptidase
MTEAMPNIGRNQLRLLEKLCNASAVSGDESEVRRIVLDEVKPLVDDVQVDALGNVLATKRGTGKKKVRVMLDAHMDEVGLMLVAEEGDGLFRFEIVGGIDLRQLPGTPVLVGRAHLPGAIGARPMHLTTPEERSRRIPLDALRVDVGPGNGGKVKVGDRVVFATRFRQIGPSLMAKALDDRLGVATLIELLRSAPPNVDLCLAFSVQEEIGSRGAKVAAHYFGPDLAIAVDSTPAHDLPAWDGSENTSYNTRLGLGPAIYRVDSRSFSDPRLVSFLVQTAEADKIPYQLRQPGGGNTDAAEIQRALDGIPSVSVSVPHRYTHSAASLARLDDWKNTLRLLQAALEKISPELLREERRS